MSKARRVYGREFKLKVLREHESGKGATQVCRELDGAGNYNEDHAVRLPVAEQSGPLSMAPASIPDKIK